MLQSTGYKESDTTERLNNMGLNIKVLGSGASSATHWPCEWINPPHLAVRRKGGGFHLGGAELPMYFTQRC